MSSKYQEDRKLFHRAHYEILAARFREELTFELGEQDPIKRQARMQAYVRLARRLADRFAIDNHDFDEKIWFEKCSPNNEVFQMDAHSWIYEEEI
jgi:hypothetical protein